MTLIPFPPATEIVAALEFQTRVLGAYSAEQRLSRRPAPRLRKQFTFELFGEEIEHARTLAARIAAGSAVVSLPDWRYAIGLSISSAQVTFTVGDTAALYEDGATVFLYSTPSQYAERTVVSTTASTVTVNAGAGFNATLGQIAPVWTGIAPGGVAITPRATGYALGGIEATLQGYVDLGSTAVPATYESIELLAAERLTDGDLSETVVRPHDVTDNGQGPLVATQQRSYTSGRMSLSFDIDGPQELFAIESFFHRRRGRLKPFFASTDTRDFEPPAGVGGASFDVPEFLTVPEVTGKRLLLTQMDGTETATTVTGGSIASGTLTVNVSPSLPTVAASGIAHLSELALVRCNTDTIEIRKGIDGTSRISVPVWRVDNEL